MAPEKLESLPARDHGALNVIVETSKGQRSKFKYDSASLAFTAQSEPMILMEQGIAQGRHGLGSAAHHREKST